MKTIVEEIESNNLRTTQNPETNHHVFNIEKALFLPIEPKHFTNLRDLIPDYKAPSNIDKIFDGDDHLSLPYKLLKNHPDIIKSLVTHGVDISNRDKKDNTLLHIAARNRDTKVVKALLECKADSNAKNYKYETPLLLAAEKGNIKIIELLIECEADIEIPDKYGFTPLLAAANTGQLATVKYLLEKGADIEAKELKGSTSLFQAITNGHIELVKLLLEKGAYTELPGLPQNLSTALSVAAFYRYPEILKLLLEKGTYTESNIETIINDNKTAPEIMNILTTFQMIKHSTDLLEKKHQAELVSLKSKIESCKHDLALFRLQFQIQENQINALEIKLREFDSIKQLLIENRIISPEQIGQSPDHPNYVPDIDIDMNFMGEHSNLHLAPHAPHYNQD